MTDKSRVEALQRQLTEQVERIQSDEDRRRMLDLAARADRSPRRDTAIVAGVPNVAVEA